MKSRYSAEEKLRIVMESFEADTSTAEFCRKNGIGPIYLKKWREQFIQGGKTALSQHRGKDTRDDEIDELKRVIGEQAIVIEAFKKRLGGRSR